jgi:hypothetical protein
VRAGFVVRTTKTLNSGAEDAGAGKATGSDMELPIGMVTDPPE